MSVLLRAQILTAPCSTAKDIRKAGVIRILAAVKVSGPDDIEAVELEMKIISTIDHDAVAPVIRDLCFTMNMQALA
jgi:hypothetical protein